jgi:hypothetical protein
VEPVPLRNALVTFIPVIRLSVSLALAGTDEIFRESLTKKLATLKEELGGMTPLERLLGERVAACWLNVYYIDALYAERLNYVTAEQGEYFQRRQERAQRLYLSAIRTLAQVRRLLVPVVQVNIGAQQVNVANGSSGK